MNSDEGVCPRQQVRRIKMLMNMPSLEKLAHEIGAILDKPLPRPGQKITVRSVEDPVGKTSMLLNVYGEINGKKWGSIYSFKTYITSLWSDLEGGRWIAEKRVNKTRRNEVREEINQSNVELVKKLLNVATQIGDHPYLKQKGLTRYEDYPLYELSSKYVDRIYNKRSLRESRVILAPLQDIHGTIRTVQFINEAGKKFFIKGGMKGCFFLTKELKSAEIIGIAEGVATALSVSQVQGFPVVAAMSCCNLKNIAQIIKEHYPKAELIILADKGGNGEKMAKEAARQTSSRVAVPEFTDEEVDKFKKQTGKEPNDFNDYYLVRGEL